ncbi:efflux RND transporter periplasmic adaptor subunit [Massilia sp. NR 4-1]|uniref:efflux RND transporter periplasmic adaptor subunit n=1 Tax=Massilia sp. NR 4-1 TaxID=1678028 RepID=UPI000AE774DF|nr:efflux RND transporter periplasmic adaptor subunit [Massilia sp. NR 4-1]
MKQRILIGTVVAALGLGAGGAALYQAGLKQGRKAGHGEAAPATKASTENGRKVLYWHDPMVPGQRFNKPGKSPFMDMELVPVYADEAEASGTVRIRPELQQNLGIRTAPVSEGAFGLELNMVGNVAWDERAVSVVPARASGFVERLHVRAPLQPVRRGQALAELYMPEWVAAQEEYLAVRAMRGSGMAGLEAAARQRMRLVGMEEPQIRQVEASGKVLARLTLTAPRDGVVAELSAREGMAVAAGTPLFRINGLSSVWLLAEVPEAQAASLHPGAAVQGQAAALPGVLLRGKVAALLPEVDAATRTLKARIELDNPAGRLAPGMFVTLSLPSAQGRPALSVPSDAVVQTGRRSVVFVTEAQGEFLPVEVQTGAESGGRTEIRSGLSAGQQVVVSGQFLLDSEASLRGTAERMGANATARSDAGQAPGAKPDPHADHGAHGGHGAAGHSAGEHK